MQLSPIKILKICVIPKKCVTFSFLWYTIRMREWLLINIAYLIDLYSLRKTDFLAYTVLTTINRQGGDC